MIDALLQAEELVEKLPEAVSRRKLGERLSKSIVELGTSDRQIQRLSTLIQTAELIDYGRAPHQREVLAEVEDCARSVGEALVNAEDAEGLRQAVFEYSNDFIKVIGTLERSVRDHWRALTAERFRPLVGLGELLRSMNVPNNLGDRLVDCGERGVSSGNMPSAMDLHSAVTTLMTEYAALQAERAAEIGEGEVGDFINALADKRATLAMVTSTVHQWLERHSALERLSVRTW
jgi:hypothetical protein